MKSMVLSEEEIMCITSFIQEASNIPIVECIYLVPYFSDLLDNYLSSLPQNGILTVKYQDEHLKSPLGMVVTLQFIEHFVRKINKPFTLKFINEEYTENGNRYDIDSNIDNDYDRNDFYPIPVFVCLSSGHARRCRGILRFYRAECHKGECLQYSFQRRHGLCHVSDDRKVTRKK